MNNVEFVEKFFEVFGERLNEEDNKKIKEMCLSWAKTQDERDNKEKIMLQTIAGMIKKIDQKIDNKN